VSAPVRVAHVTTVDLSLRFLLLDQLRRLRDEGFEVTGISAPGPWVADLQNEGIRHIAWPHATRAWDPRADSRAFAELYRILRRERFDIVHTHNPKPGIMGRIAARLARVPHVVNTVHGLYTTPEDRLRKRVPVLLAEWFAARSSHAELYQSAEDLSWARRLRIVTDDRAALLGNGVDLVRFDAAAVSPDARAALRRDLGIPPDAVVVGVVGRLVAEKGYRELFEAASWVRRHRPDVRFLVVGDPDRSKPDAIGDAEIDRARGDVIFTGWRADVRDLLAVMDAFVLASWREGMPRSAIEAAAMGLPLVLTNIRGCREVARNEIEGLLVPARDVVALTAAIDRVVVDDRLRRRMGAAARARAEASFDQERVCDIVIATYHRLLGTETHPGVDAPDGLRVRRARTTDRAAMARLHRESLPDAFLPALGDPFLRRLYRALATDEDAICSVAENGAGVVGFVAATRSVGRTYRRFALRHGIAAGLAAAPRLVRPGVARRAFETARYPSGAARLPDAELLSIAVAPEWRKRGVGQMLTADLLRRLRERGASELKVVVADDNAGANRFYERLGFRPVARVEVHGGTNSNVLVLSWPSS
jgi:glycosyltransferase involved in cell wall biosynthesis/ribosomal protein S18 acetylase RimI-like enzyme